jgi:hypothetical protein
MHATHWKGRPKFVCNTGSLKKNATDCKQWAVYEEELLPLVCRKLVQTVDEEILKVIQAKAEEAPLTDLDHLLDQIRAKEGQVQKASQRYLTAPDDLQPVLLEQLRSMKNDLAEMQERYQLQANQNNQTGLKHFVDWWREVRDRLVLTADRAPASLTLDGGEVDVVPASAAEGEYLCLHNSDNGEAVLTTPDQLRSLLHRLGCRVVCHFGATGTKKKGTPGRGRGKSYRLTRVRLSMNTNDLDGYTSRPTRW